MDKIHNTFTKIIKLSLSLIILLPLLSCSKGRIDPKKDVFDRQTGVSRQETKDILFGNKDKNSSSKTEQKTVAIPKSSRMIAIPAPPKISQQKLISFSVTDQVPLKDVLIELAKVAKLDIDLDPQITGGVIINAKNRPLFEVLDRICDMGSLRYTFENNVLHIERDLPFSKSYVVDYLVDGDLWTQVESNVTRIITNDESAATTSSLSSNKPAGLLTVYANQKAQQKVSNYLKEVRQNASTQVLIEAKVVEVTLKDNYQTGIDWTWVNGNNTITQVGGADSNSPPLTIALTGTKFFRGDLTPTITALEEFGTVKAISSPRINALNNQKATLNFTEKLVYFITEAESNTAAAGDTSNTILTFTSTKNEETTGTELGITPSIDLKNNEITLNIQPKITVKSSDAEQPYYNPRDGTEIGRNLIPIINTREITTTAKIKSGNILVIGGVMSETTTNNDKGIPFLGRIPFLGNLFKKVTKNTEVKETVIFVKATIVNSNNVVEAYDKKIHDNFTSSARPFFNDK
jgi:general secretion pathway protein D